MGYFPEHPFRRLDLAWRDWTVITVAPTNYTIFVSLFSLGP